MRKILLIGIVIGVLLIPEMKTQAEEEQIKSKGKIEGIINFYSDDIKYLKNEIDELLEECREETYYE